MGLRTRKLVGTIVLIALITVWTLLAMGSAQALPYTSGLGVTIYYVVMELGWVLPAMPLVRWMQRPDAVRD